MRGLFIFSKFNWIKFVLIIKKSPSIDAILRINKISLNRYLEWVLNKIKPSIIEAKKDDAYDIITGLISAISFRLLRIRSLAKIPKITKGRNIKYCSGE